MVATFDGLQIFLIVILQSLDKTSLRILIHHLMHKIRLVLSSYLSWPSSYCRTWLTLGCTVTCYVLYGVFLLSISHSTPFFSSQSHNASQIPVWFSFTCLPLPYSIHTGISKQTSHLPLRHDQIGSWKLCFTFFFWLIFLISRACSSLSFTLEWLKRKCVFLVPRFFSYLII